jgi:GNAT superfamily N-acetyltransferase
MSKVVQQIRKAAARDATYIFDLDLKCFDDPWSTERWEEINKNSNAAVWVGCNHQVPISLLVVENQWFIPPESEHRAAAMHIHKLCVKDVFRKRGVGVRLLAHAHQEAVKVRAKWITMIIPEWLVNPNIEGNCLGWLSKYKFKALKTLEVTIPMYGKNYDQYLFGYEMKNVN